MSTEETVGRRIKRFREEAGLTTSELAEQTRIAKSYLSALENSEDDERRRPGAETLYRIADVLGVAMSDLLGKPILAGSRSERPASLEAFARGRGLPESDVEMLASIRFRGEEPKTAERWQFIYQAIKNSAPMDDQE